MKGIRYQVLSIRLISTLLVLFSLLVTGYWLLVTKIVAQSPTPTPDEKVEEIREAVRERVQETRADQKKAFVGEISEITDSTLALETHLGENQVRAGEETIIIGLEKDEIDFEDLEIGSFAIAMGYIEETGILDARRIVIDQKPKVAARLIAFGEVTDKSSEEKILTVKHPQKGTVYMVEVTEKTEITTKVEGEIETIKYEEINVGDFLAAVGTPAEENENSLTAKIIHVISSLAEGLEKATPTPEATPSPEATPTPEIEE